VPGKILIIDDDYDIVESMKIVLESNGYDVSSASSGEEGVKKINSTKYDLIVLDVMLESIDKGFDVAKQLKADPKHRDIPILMLTAIKEVTDINFNAGNTYTDQLPPDYFSDPNVTDSKNIDNLRVEAFYEKPIKPEELLKKIKQLLNKD
jgi:CheY-like chemotaxis protein